MLQIGKWVECEDGRFVNLEQVLSLTPITGRIMLEGPNGCTVGIITTKTPESLTRTILRSISNRNYKDGEKE